MEKLDKRTINYILKQVVGNGSFDREQMIEMLHKLKASGVNKPQEFVYTETDYQMAYHKGYYEGTLAMGAKYENKI